MGLPVYSFKRSQETTLRPGDRFSFIQRDIKAYIQQRVKNSANVSKSESTMNPLKFFKIKPAYLKRAFAFHFVLSSKSPTCSV